MRTGLLGARRWLRGETGGGEHLERAGRGKAYCMEEGGGGGTGAHEGGDRGQLQRSSPQRPPRSRGARRGRSVDRGREPWLAGWWNGDCRAVAGAERSRLNFNGVAGWRRPRVHASAHRRSPPNLSFRSRADAVVAPGSGQRVRRTSAAPHRHGSHYRWGGPARATPPAPPWRRAARPPRAKRRLSTPPLEERTVSRRGGAVRRDLVQLRLGKGLR